jgi:hypothetical protein
MKILLCLLSDQHIPNLLSVHHFRPDRLVIVESKGMRNKKAAEHFKNALQLGGLAYTPDTCLVQPLDMEDDLNSTRQCLQRAYGRFPAEEWTVNLSGGTKPMSIAAYEFFKAVGARLVYVNFQRPGEMLGLDGQATETCVYQPAIREFLAGYGFESKKGEADIAQAEERAERCLNCAMLIARQPVEQSLLRLGDLSDREIKKRWDDARKKGIELSPGFLAPESAEVRAELVRIFSLTEAPGGLRGKIDKYAVEFLTGGWLEVFVWGMMRRHAAALGIWDVRLGIAPVKIGVETPSDFDVAFMHGYRLWMVECKSGAQAHDPGAEVLHKVEAVVRQFRALGIRSCLATTSTNVLAKDGKLKQSIIDRADIYQCAIVLREQIQRLAQSPDDAELVRALVLENRPT